MNFDKEYYRLTNDIIMNDNFIVLKKDIHHGSNKFDHCKRVSYLSYVLAKVFKADCKKTTRAGLLHDFFYGSRTDREENNYLKHPKTSVNNAKLHFNISEQEAEIIESHMFHHALVKRMLPFTKEEEKRYFKEKKPKNKEAVIVCLADLLVSIFEVCVYKVRYTTCLYALFLLNIMRY